MKVFDGTVINEIDSANLLESSDFIIDDGAKLIEMILDNTYKDPIAATVREICQNASEVDPNFSVHLPTGLEPWFGVIDNGTGLSREDVVKYASGLGASTKDKDNTKVGGFGIGMKVPFTMSDQYTIISRYGCMKYTFSAYKDEFGKARLVEMNHPQPTTEPNGLEMRVPVETSAHLIVKDKLVNALRYFDPKPKTNVEVEWEEITYTMYKNGWGLRGGNEQYTYEKASRVIMGNLWYEIDEGQIYESYNDIYHRLLRHRVDIFLPIRAVDLPLSREGIRYTPQTIELIRKQCDRIIEGVKADIQAEIEKCDNIWEAAKFYRKLRGLISLLEIKLTYKGDKVTQNVTITPPQAEWFFINRIRWSYKTLALDSGYIYRTLEGSLTLSYSDENFKVIVCTTDDKRIPSRLVKHMSEFHRNDNLYVVKCEPEDVKKTIKYLKDTLGWDADVFSTTVKDYKPNTAKGRAIAKKIAKVLLFTKPNYMWEDNDKLYWKDDDIKLDENTGIYLDLRAYRPYESKYASTNTKVLSLFRALIQYDFIPEGTVLYGCPGSYKNKMVDHPNYMSLDEAIDEALSQCAQKLKGLTLLRYRFADAVKETLSGNNIPLDIDVKGSYYNLYRASLKGDDELNKMLSFKKELNDLSYNIYDDCHKVTKKFFQRYPLLQHVNISDVDKTVIEEYIDLKENCNV